MRKIKVIIKRPDERYGHMTWVSDNLENLQSIVEGPIEVVNLGFTTPILVICNEEGKLNGLPKNFSSPMGTFVGTVIICGVSDGGFGDIPINMSLWKSVMEVWNET